MRRNASFSGRAAIYARETEGTWRIFYRLIRISRFVGGNEDDY